MNHSHIRQLVDRRYCPQIVLLISHRPINRPVVTLTMIKQKYSKGYNQCKQPVQNLVYRRWFQ